MQQAFERIEWIDIVKGIGILLVAGAHIFDPTAFSHVTYWFHMPIFFFISGYLFRKQESYHAYLVRKIQHLIIPYLCFLVLLSIPAYAAVISRLVDDPGFPTFRPLLILTAQRIWGGMYLQGWVGIFWFVSCLFITQQAYCIFSLYTRNENRDMGILMVISLIAASINSSFCQDFPFPLDANVVTMALPIFCMGRIYRKLSESARNKLTLTALVIAAIALILDRSGIYTFTFEMKTTNFGLPGIGFLIAVAFSVLMIRFSALLERHVPLPGRMFSFVGSYSLIIMFLHQPIQAVMYNDLGIESMTARFAAAILLPLVVGILCSKNDLLKTLFLGDTRTSLARRMAQGRLYRTTEPLAKILARTS